MAISPLQPDFFAAHAINIGVFETRLYKISEMCGNMQKIRTYAEYGKKVQEKCDRIITFYGSLAALVFFSKIR
jgi:hypothetical protein